MAPRKMPNLTSSGNEHKLIISLSRSVAAWAGLGDVLNWKWILLYALGTSLGFALVILTLLVIHAFLKSMRFREKRGRQEEKVPYKDPVEFYYCSVAVEMRGLCACLLEKQPDATLYDMCGPFEQLEDKYLKINLNGGLPILVHNGHPVFEVNEIFNYIEANFEGTLVPTTDDGTKELMRRWYLGCPDVGSMTLITAVKMLSTPTTIATDKFSLLQVFRLMLKHPNPLKMTWMFFRCLVRPFQRAKRVPHHLVVQSAFSSIDAILRQLEALLQDGRDYVIGSLSMADFFLASHMERLEVLGVLEFVIGDYSCVRKYWSRLKDRESFKLACHPPEQSKMSQVIARCLETFRKEVVEVGPVVAFELDQLEEEEE